MANYDYVFEENGIAFVEFWGIKIGDVNFSNFANDDCNTSPNNPFEPPPLLTDGSGENEDYLDNFAQQDNENKKFRGDPLASDRLTQIYLDINLQNNTIDIRCNDLRSYKALQFELVLPDWIRILELEESDMTGASEAMYFFDPETHSIRLVWWDPLQDEASRKEQTLVGRFKINIADDALRTSEFLNSEDLSLSEKFHNYAYLYNDLDILINQADVRAVHTTEKTLSVYPNPASDFVTFHFEKNTANNRALVDLFTLDGVHVYSTQHDLEDNGHVVIDLTGNIGDQVLFYRATIGIEVYSGKILRAD